MVMKIKTNDIESIRHINTIMVLNELRNTDHLLSRPNIADNLGLSKVTVSNIARELNEQNLTVDAGFGVPDSRGGRKPLLLDLDRVSRRVIGLRLESGSLEFSLCDITGRELQNSQGRPQAHDNLSLISAMLNDLLLRANTPKNAILGLAALVEDGMEDTLDKAGAADHSASLADKLQARLEIPVRATDFTRARAFAESWHKTQAGKRRVSFFYIELGLELDCVAVRKSLLDPLSCEFGACHMTALQYGENGPYVTVDSLLSGQAMLRRAAILLNREVDFNEMKALAAQGDRKMAELTREYGYWLGCALALVVNMAGLRKIILGGVISELWPFFERTMLTGIEGHVSENLKNKIKVRVIDEKFADGLKGAVAQALDWWIFRTDLLYDAVPTEIMHTG